MKPKTPGDRRFAHALEFIEGVRASRPELPTELVDSVQDGLVDLLRKRPEYGGTRAAVFALGRKQLVWRIKDWQRKRLDPDGGVRDHPSAARSLDREFIGIDGEGRNLYGSTANRSAHDPERLYLVRQEFAELLARAREDGPNTLRMIQAEILGMTTRELAASLEVEVNTIHQWKSRFRARRRRESE